MLCSLVVRRGDVSVKRLQWKSQRYDGSLLLRSDLLTVDIDCSWLFLDVVVRWDVCCLSNLCIDIFRIVGSRQ